MLWHKPSPEAPGATEAEITRAYIQSARELGVHPCSVRTYACYARLEVCEEMGYENQLPVGSGLYPPIPCIGLLARHKHKYENVDQGLG